VDPQANLEAVRADLKQSFISRDRVIDGMLIGLLCRQHILLLGPPGTAKSLLARQLCSALDARYFEWLLTKFTTPEEVFGPVDLPALEAGRYERVTHHKLPEAEIVFLDEVFKANSAILNALLTVMNERRFHQGTSLLEVPLETLIAASNELPEEDELRALLDRFLLRFQVEYLDESGFRELLRLSERSLTARLTPESLSALRQRVAAAAVPESVLDAVSRVRRELLKEGVVPSDRRFRLGLGVLRAAAVLDGRSEVHTGDLQWLAHVLWTEPEEQRKVEAALAQLSAGYEDELRRISSLAREVYGYAQRDWPDPQSQARAALEAHTKLAELSRRVAELIVRAKRDALSTDRLEQVKGEIDAMQTTLLGASN
jgi:MoxR-like ATPase